MSRLKRFAISTGVTLVALSGVTGYWYKKNYILSPEPERKVILPVPNGYDTLQEALKLELGGLDGVTNSPTKDEPLAPLSKRLALLEANKASIEKTREALKQEFRQPIVESPGTDFPKYARVREQARMLAFAARTYAEAGNTPEAMTCALDAIELGVKLPRGGMLIGNMVGIACEAIGQKAAWGLADKLSPTEASGAAERLTRIRAARWPFENILEEERLFARQLTRSAYEGGPLVAWKSAGELLKNNAETSDTMDGMAGLEASPQPSVVQQTQRLWLRTQMVYYGPKTTLENGDRWMQALQAQAKAPWNPSRPDPEMPSDPLNQILAPVFAQARFKQVHAEASLALLEGYLRLRSSESPTLPIDPFSQGPESLRYRREGESTLLWSIGPDAKDDAGKPIDMEGKRGYVTVDKTGDFVARVNTW